MSKSDTPTDDTKNSTDVTASRRSVLKGAGAAAASGVIGSSLIGTASAAPVAELQPLATKGNKIVDENGNAAQLNGANLIDPLRSYRGWRGKTIEEQFQKATNDEWAHNMIRLPCQPQDISSSRTPGQDTNDSMMAHGDNWGPVKPGTISRDDVTRYLDNFVRPVVDLARERNVYVLIDYHTHIPIFHQAQFAAKTHRGIDFWQSGNYNCTQSSKYNWDWDEGMCGHRGYLWHGPDQVSDFKNLQDNQNKLNDPELHDPWFDPWCGADGGEDLVGQEITMFWDVVSDYFSGDSDDHVVFDLFNEPTGPYFGDWGEPGRMPAGEDGYDSGSTDVTNEQFAKPYWELFMERSKEWLNVVAENAPGRLMTMGNPRWSQWTYWAKDLTYNGVNGTNSVTGMHDGANNVAYTAHSYVQEGLRPLAKTFGTPSKRVPVMYSEFGWEAGGGPDWFTHLGGTTAVFGDGDPDAIEQWGRPEGKPDPANLTSSEQELMNHFEMDANDPDKPNPEDFVGYREFFENFPVQPFAWCFDHTWAPRFFSDQDTDNWQLMPRNDTPGQWWNEYVTEHGEDSPPGDSNTNWENISGAESETGESAGPTPTWPTDPAPTDVDDDGLYEDLNGNGKVDFPDVNMLFQNRDSVSGTDNAQFYDFTGDGSINLQDVISIFRMV